MRAIGPLKAIKTGLKAIKGTTSSLKHNIFDSKSKKKKKKRSKSTGSASSNQKNTKNRKRGSTYNTESVTLTIFMFKRLIMDVNSFDTLMMIKEDKSKIKSLIKYSQYHINILIMQSYCSILAFLFVGCSVLLYLHIFVGLGCFFVLFLLCCFKKCYSKKLYKGYLNYLDSKRVSLNSGHKDSLKLCRVKVFPDDYNSKYEDLRVRLVIVRLSYKKRLTEVAKNGKLGHKEAKNGASNKNIDLRRIPSINMNLETEEREIKDHPSLPFELPFSKVYHGGSGAQNTLNQFPKIKSILKLPSLNLDYNPKKSRGLNTPNTPWRRGERGIRVVPTKRVSFINTMPVIHEFYKHPEELPTKNNAPSIMGKSEKKLRQRMKHLQKEKRKMKKAATGFFKFAEKIKKKLEERRKELCEPDQEADGGIVPIKSMRTIKDAAGRPSTVQSTANELTSNRKITKGGESEVKGEGACQELQEESSSASDSSWSQEEQEAVISILPALISDKFGGNPIQAVINNIKDKNSKNQTARESMKQRKSHLSQKLAQGLHSKWSSMDLSGSNLPALSSRIFKRGSSISLSLGSEFDFRHSVSLSKVEPSDSYAFVKKLQTLNRLKEEGRVNGAKSEIDFEDIQKIFDCA